MLFEIEAVQHLVGDPHRRSISLRAAGFLAHEQRRDDLQPGAVVADVRQKSAEVPQDASGLRVGPALHRSDDGQEPGIGQASHPLDAAREGPLSADGVVHLRGDPVQANSQLQGIRRSDRQPGQLAHRPLRQEGRVGQHRRRAQLQGILEDAAHLVIHEGLATGEVVLLHPQRDGLGEGCGDLVAGHEPERVVVRAARDEAVAAAQVAHRSAHLEPELVQSPQRHLRRRLGDARQSRNPASAQAVGRGGRAGKDVEVFHR